MLWILTFAVCFPDSWFPLYYIFLPWLISEETRMLCGFSEQQELAISSLAWIRTFLPAGLVVLFNKHAWHITLLLKASHGFPASSEETWGSPPCCLWGPSGSVPDSPPSLWALPSCVFYAAPAPSAPPWGLSSHEGHIHFQPRHLLLPLPGLCSPHKAPGLHTLSLQISAQMPTSRKIFQLPYINQLSCSIAFIFLWRTYLQLSSYLFPFIISYLSTHPSFCSV